MSPSHPDPPALRVRLVLAVSLDGRLAPPAGGAAQIGGAPDRRVLEQALAWADGALIGAGTLRLHGTTCLIRDPRLLQERRRRGRPEQPISLLVSGSGRLPARLPYFAQPLQRWLLTCPSRARTPASGFQRTLPLHDWSTALADLARAGIGRLVVLGGARLLGSMLAADAVDELQLTLCPTLLGGEHVWLPPGCGAPPRWRCLAVARIGEGEVLLRYGRDR